MDIKQTFNRHLRCHNIHDIIDAFHLMPNERIRNICLLQLRPTRTNWVNGHLYVSQARVQRGIRELKRHYPRYADVLSKIEAEIDTKPCTVVI